MFKVAQLVSSKPGREPRLFGLNAGVFTRSLYFIMYTARVHRTPPPWQALCLDARRDLKGEGRKAHGGWREEP